MAITDGTYGLTNNLIGQIKTIIQNDTKVTIISDNNPDNTIARVLVYSVSGCAHYFKIASASTAKFVTAILKLDGSTELYSYNSASSYATNTAYDVYLLHNSTIHALLVKNSASVYPMFIAIDVSDPGGWYSLGGFTAWSSTYSKFYKSDSDLTYEVAMPSFGALQNGLFVAIPIRFKEGLNLLAYYHNYCYCSLDLLTSGVHQDTLGKYYLSCSLPQGGITFKDP